MDTIFVNKNYIKFKARCTMELCGLDIYSDMVTVRDNGNINFNGDITLTRVYNILSRTDFASVMYAYDAGAAVQIILNTVGNQERLLATCNNFIEEICELKLEEFRGKQLNIIEYAEYYARYIKVWIVDYIEDLTCDICRAYRAKEYTMETLLDKIKNSVNEHQNYSLYRIIAKILTEFSDYEQSVQLLELLYSWDKHPKDLFEALFFKMSFDRDTDNCICERLKDIDRCEAYLLKAYAHSDNEDSEAELAELFKGIDAIERDCIYIFSDFVHTMGLIGEIQCATYECDDMERYNKYSELRDKKVEEAKGPADSQFIEMAMLSYVSKEELSDMIDYYMEVTAPSRFED